MVTIPPEIVNGVLVNAISATGRMLVGSAFGMRSRRSAADLDIARWFDTYQLTGEGPNIAVSDPDQIETVLRRDEAQAVLQELLAARLTEAPEADISRIHAGWELSFAQDTHFKLDLELVGQLFDYYDTKIGELVARLEASDPPALAQIRSDAYSTRINDVLNAIERHTAALSARPNERTEASFLTSYRRHVVDHHGKLEPPDFERRHRVPIADIYVPASITEDLPAERAVALHPVDRPSLTVFDLAGLLDRTVLLGDPGGGKTTASNVLMHHFASDETRRVPFLVTLREYAAKDPPEHSVVGHIEHNLAAFYQCPAPAGLVDLLLLTGRAGVIFDGLDELLDTSRRIDVTARVERFCAEYPQAPVLVTSRAVGYDQARLNDRQFTCYRLGGFGDEQVVEYVQKWFAQDPDARAGEAEAFRAESQSIRDLCANPLLLSLMCIMYRGEGSLPSNRAEVYEQCASLLFRKWDARRHIHRELRAGRLVDAALRHLAWWLFTSSETPAVTERQLVTETMTFLHNRGFESADDARDAAREFVEFCRGRMWVFSDVGTTSAGEKLYAFTHRTFLEYFAAAQLAYDSDTPERLARSLAPRIANSEWEVVSELAVQIKDNTITDGARRIYAELLGERRRRSAEGRSGILQFLARTLRSVDPSPQTVRALTNEVLRFLFSGERERLVYCLPLVWLLRNCGSCRNVVDEEISIVISGMVASDNPTKHLDGLRLAISLTTFLYYSRRNENPSLANRVARFWEARTEANVRTYAEAIIRAAADDGDLRSAALDHNLITIEQALRMPGSLLPLLQLHGFRVDTSGSYLLTTFWWLARGRRKGSDFLAPAIRDMAAVGRYFRDHPQPPWIAGETISWSDYNWDPDPSFVKRSEGLDPVTYLGAAGVLLISAESDSSRPPAGVLGGDASRLGPFSDLYAYLERRSGQRGQPLSDLPVPDAFKQLFRDWAEDQVNFTT